MPPFGGDDQAGWVGVESFADEALGDFGAVGVGGVDEVDTEFDGTAENAAAFFRVAGLAPGAVSDKAHGSIAEAVDLEIAADFEGAGERMQRVRS